MKIAYFAFVPNGADDQFKLSVSASLNVREFLDAVVKELCKATSWSKDAGGAYFVAMNLDTLQAKPLGLFKLDIDGNIYPQIGRGQCSGTPETPEELRERAERKLIDLGVHALPGIQSSMLGLDSLYNRI